MKETLKWQLAQKLEAIWWYWYLRNKQPESYLKWKLDYWRDFLSKIENLIHLDDSKILDAGCGPAGIFTLLKNHNITALDPLLTTYEKRTFFRRSNYPKVHFIDKTIEEFTSEEKFDLVFCLNAINHVNEIGRALNSLRAALKSDGLLVLTTDLHHNNTLKNIFRLIPGDALHPHQYSHDDYRCIFEKSGFSVVSTQILKKEIIF